MQQPLILFSQDPAKLGQIGLISLNRPQALNAINGEMILMLDSQLQKWAVDPAISLVIIQSSDARAFCAGGDLKEVYQYGMSGNEDGLHFYATEYKLDEFIYDYPKPYIALLNGIAMGGGLGISLHSRRVIASENLQLAMPETGIGFFPDVGAGYFFQRCPNKIGMYLGLTGTIIGIADAIYANLVNAYVPSKYMPKLIEELAKKDLSIDPLAEFDGIVKKFKQDPGSSSLQQYADVIERCFSKKSVEAIIIALEQDATPWAKQQLNILATKSPTSLKVTFKELTLGASLQLAECLAMEFKLARQIFKQHDVYEGIRALLIDKTRDPKWQPATLQEVNDNDIEKLFK